MAYIELTDLKSHLRAEIIDKITREDDEIPETAIIAAIAEAKSYLGKYNLTKLFDETATGFVNDINLKMKVKDLACWHLVKLANPNINMATFRSAYEDAIDWLKLIQKGQTDPDGWPYKTDDADTAREEGQGFFSTSNEKKRHHW